MGTSNFARGNTSRVFAVLMDEQVDVEDFVEFVREIAKESAPKDIQYSKEDGRDRNASNLFSYRVSKWYGDIEVEVQVIAKMVSAYYEGASLDFEFTIFDGNHLSDSDDAVLYAFDQSDMNDGMKVIQQRHAQRWVDRVKDQLIALTEQVFEQVSMPLRVVATFSNGETIYSQLK